MVWAAGIRSPGFLADIEGLPRNHIQQLCVRANLQVDGDPHILAVGDSPSLTPARAARPLPPTAQVANQQAPHLARHLPGDGRASWRDRVGPSAENEGPAGSLTQTASRACHHNTLN